MKGLGSDSTYGSVRENAQGMCRFLSSAWSLRGWVPGGVGSDEPQSPLRRWQYGPSSLPLICQNHTLPFTEEWSSGIRPRS
ncbi:Norsolorinic acid reductase A [Fusarium oxysporum f. sp. albedinis]|nr:Norsolorinic acid reductase A [Fusarium oxysporum f. sp. albedinis]